MSKSTRWKAAPVGVLAGGFLLIAGSFAAGATGVGNNQPHPPGGIPVVAKAIGSAIATSGNSGSSTATGSAQGGKSGDATSSASSDTTAKSGNANSGNTGNASSNGNS